MLAACSGVSSVPSVPNAHADRSQVTKIVSLVGGSGIAFVAPNGQRLVTASVDKSTGNVEVINSVLGTHTTISYEAINRGIIVVGGGVTMNTTNPSHVSWTSATGTDVGRLDLVNGTYFVSSAALGLSNVALVSQAPRGHIEPMDCAGAKQAYVLDGIAFSVALASFAAAPEVAPIDYLALVSATAALKNAIDQVNKECK